ncbi:MAG: hypothetical protein NTZ86_08665 [Legionellales bacterium]|nr:hypothetical protein [Legionellales bacterium]
MNALAFEADYESNLVALCDEINSGLYQPGRSIAFVIHKPVKREIFAASFRDRVVHHWLINQLNPFFEKAFMTAMQAEKAAVLTWAFNAPLAALEHFIAQRYPYYNKAIVLELCQKIVMNDPSIHCLIKGKRAHWDDFPKEKSLFFATKERGIIF